MNERQAQYLLQLAKERKRLKRMVTFGGDYNIRSVSLEDHTGFSTAINQQYKELVKHTLSKILEHVEKELDGAGWDLDDE